MITIFLFIAKLVFIPPLGAHACLKRPIEILENTYSRVEVTCRTGLQFDWIGFSRLIAYKA